MPSPDANAVQAQLERVLASPSFQASKNLARFLRYVVERTLAGQSADIKEYSIAVEVFGRPETFDPRSDGVVRVQAGHLRKKLDAYYQQQGASDNVIISVPRGGYVPEFGERSVDLRPPSRTDQKPRGPRRSLPGLALIAGVAGVVLGGAGATWWGQGSDHGGDVDDVGQAKQEAAGWRGRLWTPLLKGDHDVVLALGVPQFFSAGDVMMREVGVNAPDDVPEGSRLQQISRAVGAPLKQIEVYTGIGEAAGAMAMGQFYTRHAPAHKPLRFLRSRLVGWPQLRESHVIFLASMRFRTMADELALPIRFRLDARGDWIDVSPTGGPRPLPTVPNIEYATIVAAPGKVAGRRVLLVRGRNTWATQAAAEYITNPHSLAQLEQRLAVSSEPLDAFEVLLRVEIRDEQPVAVEYLRHHPLLPAR